MHDVHPFGAAHDPRLVVSTRARQEMLARLIDGLGRGEPFIVLTGDAGTGKSSLIAQAREAWSARGPVITLEHPAFSVEETLAALGEGLGVACDPTDSPAQRVARVRESLVALTTSERIAVLIVENAQDVSDEVLDALRHVATTADGRSTLQIVLAGLPDLEARLATPALAALQQRVAFRGRLEGLSRKETRRYVQERVTAAGGNGAERFSNETCREIWTLTHGVPRAINTLATEAMRISEAASAKVVSAEHVHQAAVALWGVTTPPPVRSEPQAHRAPAAQPSPVDVAPPAPRDPEPAPPASSPGEEGMVPAAPVKHDDPDVQAWVSKFMGEGPPRIGSRLLAEALQPSDEAISSLPRHLPPAGVTFDAPAEIDPDALALLERKRKAARRRPRRGAQRPGPALSPMSVVLLVLVIAAAAAAVLMLPRLRSLAIAFHPAATAPADPASPPAAASVAPVTVQVKTVPLRPRRLVPAVSVAPAPVPKASAAGPVAAAPDTTPKPRRTTLEVASYLSIDRAEIERDRLIAATGLDAWVVTGSEDGTEMYRVLIGIFSTQQRAESAASAVLNQGLVTQARVVPLPPKHLRR